MISKRLLLSSFTLIFWLFAFMLWWNSSSICNEKCQKTPVIFRATSKQLLNLLHIPQLPEPKNRFAAMKPFDYQVTLNERITMYKLLALFNKIMKENGIPYFIGAGTLLGSYRNHDIIPWDDDIDVFVNLYVRDDLRNVYRRNISNLVLYEGTVHDKLYFENESMQTSGQKWKWPYIDISFYKTNATHLYDIAETYGRVDTYPKSIVFPLTTRPFYDLDLPSPKDAFAYCVWSHGYTDDCVMNLYSHILEGGGVPRGKEKCYTFASRFPFVKRYLQDNDIIEELIYNGSLIQRVKVNEPKYALSKTFILQLQDGHEYPIDVDLPPRTTKENV